jgi:hypothetical protein
MFQYGACFSLSDSFEYWHPPKSDTNYHLFCKWFVEGSNGMSPRVRTIAHGIESLIDTVSDAIQAPLYVRYTLYLVYSPMT